MHAKRISSAPANMLTILLYNSTIYHSWKIKGLCRGATDIEIESNKIKTWSKDTNLVFNSSKTKTMIISSQMSHYHHLNITDKVKMTCNNKSIERLFQSQRLQSAKINHWQKVWSYLKFWKTDIPYYEHTLKRYKTFTIRKRLCESLILFKLESCGILFKSLGKYKRSGWQKLLKTCAGPPKQKYGNKEDIINLKWLLTEKRIGLSILKKLYSGLTKENILEHPKFLLKEPA